jgi:hypothetical protein
MVPSLPITAWPIAGSDDNVVSGREPYFLAGRLHDDRVRILETRRPGQNLDPVASELGPDDVDLPVDHPARPDCEVLDRDLVLDAVALTVDVTVAQTGEVEDRLPEGFGGDRARVYRNAAYLPTLCDADSLPELRGLDRAFWPAGPEPITIKS